MGLRCTGSIVPAYKPFCVYQSICFATATEQYVLVCGCFRINEEIADAFVVYGYSLGLKRTHMVHT